MNEEHTALEDQNENTRAPHDSAQTPSAPPTEAFDTAREEASVASTDEDAHGIFADTDTDPDSDCESVDPKDQKSELDELRGELMQLRRELEEHRNALFLKRASDSNTENRARSAGSVKSAESVEFSPAEVRAMTPQEVRANLPKIMRSMQKWH